MFLLSTKRSTTQDLTRELLASSVTKFFEIDLFICFLNTIESANQQHTNKPNEWTNQNEMNINEPKKNDKRNL